MNLQKIRKTSCVWFGRTSHHLKQSHNNFVQVLYEWMVVNGFIVKNFNFLKRFLMKTPIPTIGLTSFSLSKFSMATISLVAIIISQKVSHQKRFCKYPMSLKNCYYSNKQLKTKVTLNK